MIVLSINICALSIAAKYSRAEARQNNVSSSEIGNYTITVSHTDNPELSMSI